MARLTLYAESMRIHRVIQLAFVLLIAGCSSVAGTGRSQLNMISPEEERQLGIDAFNQATAEVELVRSGPALEMVERIGWRILGAAYVLYPEIEVDEEDWVFVLIDDDDVANAWAAPGGKVAIYTGILPITQTEAGLAVVVAHEVAHVLARHSAEQVTHAMLMQGIMVAGTELIEDEDTRAMAMQALGIGGVIGVALPFSRVHESEADELGLFLMAEAGYDPRVAIDVWTRMEEAQEVRTPEFLSTHPLPASRIEEFRALMPEAMELYREAEAARDRR